MTKYTDYADVFLGCDEISLPEPRGAAASWRFIKGLCGNTHPGAVLPFGRLSCCCYSGGYSAGYGRSMPNTGGPIRKLWDRNKFVGFSHFHHSGTGYIGVFYNYFVTSPFFGGIGGAFAPSDILEEKARPGYYSCRSSRGVFCECAVSDRLVFHRYSFDRPGGRVAVDVSHNGLARETGAFHLPEAAEMQVLGKTGVLVSAVQEGIRLYARIECRGASRCSLWQGDREGAFSFDPETPFGAVFDLEGQRAEIIMSISSRRESLAEPLGGLDRAAEEAEARWNGVLGRIEVRGEEKDKRIFYSNLYHTFVKPAFWTGEDMPGTGREPAAGELATMWDIYKTQLPLAFTLFEDVRKGVLASFLACEKNRGGFPHCLIMSASMDIEDKQARCLAEHSIADAFYHSGAGDDVDGVPLEDILAACDRDMGRPGREDFLRRGFCPRASHTLDMAEAAGCVAALAEAAGNRALAEKYAALWRNWPRAFGPDGLMRRDSEYYEGNYYSYSFRLMRDMPGRIALCGRKRFEEYLDAFFGFAEGSPENRFQGFNNETDMETPWAYRYIGRPDRLYRILDAALDCMFAEGRGGIPGNNDSGGLSAAYVWNALGLFPVTGQNRLLAGKCRFEGARLRLAGGNLLEIENKCGKNDPARTLFNGREALEIAVTELMKGGKLVFE